MERKISVEKVKEIVSTKKGKKNKNVRSTDCRLEIYSTGLSAACLNLMQTLPAQIRHAQSAMTLNGRALTWNDVNALGYDCLPVSNDFQPQTHAYGTTAMMWSKAEQYVTTFKYWMTSRVCNDHKLRTPEQSEKTLQLHWATSIYSFSKLQIPGQSSMTKKYNMHHTLHYFMKSITGMLIAVANTWPVLSGKLPDQPLHFALGHPLSCCTTLVTCPKTHDSVRQNVTLRRMTTRCAITVHKRTTVQS